MTKKSFNQKNPAFKWVFLFAVVAAIPLTLYSFNSISTETRSDAATYTSTCGTNGGGCYKYNCPTSGGYFQISGTCGAMTDAACCANKLAAPTGLNSSQWYCKFGTPTVEHDDANFWWDKVPNATSYTIFYRIYSSVYNYTYNSVPIGNQTSYLKPDIYKNLNGRHIQWYVRAYRGSLSSTSSVKITPTAFLSCPR